MPRPRRSSPPTRGRATACPRRAGAALALALAASGAGAQVVPGTAGTIGTPAADRARLEQVRGRPVDSLTAALGRGVPLAGGLTMRVVGPLVRLTRNSGLPAGGNDDALWAGRGLNASLTGGIALSDVIAHRRVDLVLSPTLAYSENRPFPVIPGRQAGRSAFSSPWHLGGSSADLPLRFGDRSFTTLDPGESSLTVTADHVAYGLSTASEWWGPAIRNTLLLGNNAPGVPRLFARTARPVTTRVGSIEGRVMLGALAESPFFDYDFANDVRSLSGFLVTFRPALDTGLTLGLSRMVMANAPSTAAVLGHGLDALARFEPLAASSDTTADGRSSQRTDQLISLFARWVFPASGAEAYVEWARMGLPRSLREFVDVPQSTQGYTIGMQWADPHPIGGFLRIQGEVTYLEQTPAVLSQPTPDFYTGRATAQGFTQRGQLLGAAVGPGGSTQFIGADWVAPRWQAGGFLGRTRTENDALYRQLEPREIQHDVTIFGGARGALLLARAELGAELTVGRRMSYLFQNDGFLGIPRAMDPRNVTLSLVVAPR